MKLQSKQGLVQGVMAKRVMDLLWSIMMNPEAPTEVSKSPAMTDALTAYAQRKVAVDRQVAGEYIRQCLAQIQADSSVSAAMNLLQKLVHLSVSSLACAVLSKALHPPWGSICSVCTFQGGFCRQLPRLCHCTVKISS